MRILITGSRTWDDEDYIRQQLTEIKEGLTYLQKVTLVSGACPQGADYLCEKVAAELGWEVELHPADWGTYGRKAGFERNRIMVDLGADMCLGFIRNSSKGGSMTVKLASNKGLPTVEHSWKDSPLKTFSVKYFNLPEPEAENPPPVSYLW